MQSYEELNKAKIKKASRGVLGFFVKHYRFNIILLIGIVIWGTFSLLSLPREANPEVEIPFVAVNTAFPGASPADVEELVTDKIEDKVKNLDDIKLITSTSQLSVSSVAIEFEASADLDKSFEDTKDAVDSVTNLPEDAEEPTVQQLNFNNQAIATVSLLGNLTDEQFRHLGEIIEEELESISGVSEIQTAGIREREIQVALNPGELERANITINEVLNALQSANVSLPLGSIELDNTIYNVRATGKFQTSDDLKNIVIKNTPEGNILLSDVAQINNQLRETSTLSRISVNGADPLPAVSFQVFKKTGGNIIEIVDTVKQRLTELQQENIIPQNLDIVVTNDMSQFIRNDINTLGTSGLQTIVIIFALLTLALNFRQGIVGAVSIPLVFLMTFGFLALTGSTLNSLALFALVLSMGLLVDTMIIILEGIHDGLKQGFTPRNAAFYSIETYKWPITAGVLTTISAFVPMFLVSGILGEFLKTFPATVIMALGSALFVALIILPGIMAMILDRFGNKNLPEQKSLVEKHVIDWITPYYNSFVDKLLVSRKRKITLMTGLTAVFLLAFSTVPLGVISVELFPTIDMDFFYINVEKTPGTTFKQTEKAVSIVENRIAKITEIESFVTNIGTPPVSFEADFSAQQGTENTAQIVVNLKDKDDRETTSYELASSLRKSLADITTAKITVQEVSAGPPTGAPLQIRILGDDLSKLRALSDKLSILLSQIQGVVNINSNEQITPPEFEFTLDHRKLGQYGLSASQVASTLRASLEGVTATSISLEDEDIDVRVVLQDSENLTVEALQNLNLTSPVSGQTVKLAQVSDFDISPALEKIRHRDLKRTISITADLENTDVGTATQAFEEKLQNISIPTDVEVQTGGETEDIDQSFTELWYSMSIAVILIFLIMVLQFNSFRQPFIIILTLPFAVIGVIAGTLILGLSFGFATFLGIVALAGIVVNDAIVLIDRINYNLYTREMPIREGIREAGQARLQPIIITTLTTIAGVTPLAFVDEFWRGLSVAVGFGIAFATVLTLIIMPMLYLKFQGKRWMKKRKEFTDDKDTEIPTPPVNHKENDQESNLTIQPLE